MANATAKEHVVQLGAAWIAEVGARRRPSRASDPAASAISVPRAELQSRAEDGLVIVCRIRPRIRVRVSDDEVWDASVAVSGRFTTKQPMTQELAEGFARLSALYVLWPFARVELDRLARGADVLIAPMLPLIVQPGRDRIIAEA